MEQRIINLLKSLKNLHEILEKNFNDLYPSGLKLGILYGLVKFTRIWRIKFQLSSSFVFTRHAHLQVRKVL